MNRSKQKIQNAYLYMQILKKMTFFFVDNGILQFVFMTLVLHVYIKCTCCLFTIACMKSNYREGSWHWAWFFLSPLFHSAHQTSHIYEMSLTTYYYLMQPKTVH